MSVLAAAMLLVLGLQAKPEQRSAALPVFGQVLPEIKAETWIPEGSDVTLASLRGKFVVIEFWRSDCAHCRRSLPLLEELRKKYADHVAVVGLTKSSAEDVKKVLLEHPVGFPNGVRSATAAEWKAPKVPLLYLADPQGRLLYVCKPQQLEPVLRNALAGKYPVCTDPRRVAEYDAQLSRLEQRAAEGDSVRVWVDALRIRKLFPVTHPLYDRATRLMIAQVTEGKKKLARAKVLVHDHKPDQAKVLLQEIIRDFEGALLETEADKLLQSLDLTS
jgi:cytochrome c biogenesis protein CcmG/thiol:disulfide interchange protein DsbE